jgi:hypothetical protein
MGNITFRPIDWSPQESGSDGVSDTSLVHTKLDAIKIQKDRNGLSAEVPRHMLQLRFRMCLPTPVASDVFIDSHGHISLHPSVWLPKDVSRIFGCDQARSLGATDSIQRRAAIWQE